LSYTRALGRRAACHRRARPVNAVRFHLQRICRLLVAGRRIHFDTISARCDKKSRQVGPRNSLIALSHGAVKADPLGEGPMRRVSHILLVAGLFPLSAGSFAQQPGPSPTGGPGAQRPNLPEPFSRTRTECPPQFEARAC